MLACRPRGVSGPPLLYFFSLLSRYASFSYWLFFLFLKKMHFFRVVLLYISFLHTVYSFLFSYLHQHPFLLHGTNSSGPYLFHRLFYLLYLYEPFTFHVDMLSSLSFLFFCVVGLLFQKNFFLFFTSHKTYQVNAHSPPPSPLQFNYCTIQMSLASC